MSNLQHCLHSVAFTWQLNWLAWGACEYPVTDIQCATGHMCAQERASNLLTSLLALLICILQGICSLSCAATTSLLCLCKCECLCVCICVCLCVCVGVFVHLKCTQSFVVHLPRFYFKEQLMWPASTLCVCACTLLWLYIDVCMCVCAVSF